MILGIILVVLAAVLIYPKDKAGNHVEDGNVQSHEIAATDTQISLAPSDTSESGIEIPEKKILSMSFASQAPFADWSEPWQNACEEASINIVRYYYRDMQLSKESMSDDILAMVDFQMKNWGGHNDLTADKTLALANSVYGLTGEVITNYSVESIKEYIAKDIPVIVPTDGRLLDNPNFRGDGPPYHMLVVKGYDGENFITNDPGTRKGEGYVYPYQTLLGSIKNPAGGAKELLVLDRP